MHAAAITEPAEIELAELAVAEAGLGMASARQLDAMRTHVLIDVLRHGAGVGTLENPASWIQQTIHHKAL